MKIEKYLLLESTIEKFADKFNLIMEVHERNKHGADRYYAHFKDCNIEDKDMLIGAFGSGSTPEEAINNYARRISLQNIVINAYFENCQKILVPKLIV